MYCHLTTLSSLQIFHLSPPFLSLSLSLSPILDVVKWVSLVTQMVKNQPAVQEILAGSLGHEDPLEVELATQSSILAWRIPCIEEPCRLESIGSQRVQHN